MLGVLWSLRYIFAHFYKADSIYGGSAGLGERSDQFKKTNIVPGHCAEYILCSLTIRKLRGEANPVITRLLLLINPTGPGFSKGFLCVELRIPD